MRCTTIVLTLAAALSVHALDAQAAFISGSVVAKTNTVLTKNAVTALPYTTPAVANEAGVATAESDPDLVDLVSKLSFSGTLLSSDGVAENTLNYTFTADTASTYSMFGSAASTNGGDTLSASLVDNTSGITLYNSAVSIDGTGPIALASDTTGSLTGNLTGGDKYTFTLDNTLEDQTTLFLTNIRPLAALLTVSSVSGSGGLTIVPVTLPEPTSGVILLAGGLMLLSIRRKNPTALI